jgi:hypothetical protein
MVAESQNGIDRKREREIEREWRRKDNADRTI